ncbi:MAG TPA: efflux RND transporter periplasmic adaptor subunit, partial [Terriglobales bacterium]|nr:efflux RND transporter periplasmic adaptor subunit [Terriglobales bacterium]
ASRRGEAVPIRVVKVVRDNIRSLISTNGKIEPVQNFEAHAPIPTTVKRVLVREGDHVKKGQLLIQLEDAEARSQAARALAQLKGAQADVNAIERGGTQEEVLTLDAQLVKARTARDTAQRDLNATRILQQKNLASPAEVTEAENRLNAAQADLQLLQQKQKDRYSGPEVAKVEAQKSEAQAAYDAAMDIMQKCDLRAPYDGEVYSLPVKQGVYVQAGELLLQEADLSKVLVRAFVDEPDVGRLAPNQKVEVTWDAIPGRIWQGTLNTIPSAVKLRGTRNVGETTTIIENPDRKLLPNINVGVTIVTAEHDGVLTAPREAVHLDDGKSYVFQIVDNELKRRDVQTSVSTLTEVEITNGLAENSIVALGSTNAKPLRSGMAVKVVQ